MTSAKELFAEISNQQVTDGGEVVGYFVKKSKMDLLEKYLSAPQLPAVPDDTKRMDWLCSMVVDVREPLVYGSHSIFWSQCDSADDEPHHTTLREQIDAAIAAAPKPE